MRSLWWLAVPGVIALVWGSIALGSYVYLSGMGYADSFEFPWDQLPIALSYIVDDGWHGIGTLRIWNWAAVGTAAMIAPSVIVGKVIIVRLLDRWRPRLYGKTAWADRSDLQQQNVQMKRRLF